VKHSRAHLLFLPNEANARHLHGTASLEDMDNKKNDGEYQQEVNERGCHVVYDECSNPGEK